MDDRAFLHDGEILLASQPPSAAPLVASLVRGLLDALVGGAALSVALLVLSFFVLHWPVAWYAFALLFIASYAAVVFKRWKIWKSAGIRVTTERILLHAPGGLFSHPIRTVKWLQYQESYLGHRTVLDWLFRAKPLCIRYGTPDAQLESCFPSLVYANDLKHYLDKVDAAVRKSQAGSLRPFVAKPRGKRDEEIAAAPPASAVTPESPAQPPFKPDVSSHS